VNTDNLNSHPHWLEYSVDVRQRTSTNGLWTSPNSQPVDYKFDALTVKPVHTGTMVARNGDYSFRRL